MHFPAVNTTDTLTNAYFINTGSIKVAVFIEYIRSLNLEITIFGYLAHARAVRNCGGGWSVAGVCANCWTNIEM
jgi:hypothetical protein